MNCESYARFFDGEPEGVTIRPHGKAAEFHFSAEPKKDHRYRLFTVGETEQYYLWKDEPDGPLQYHTISDSLDTKHAVKDRYCLDFSSKQSESYLKRIYKKILWTPILSYLKMNPVPTAWRLGIRITGKELCVEEGGFLRLRLDIRRKKEGVGKRSVAGAPDESLRFDLPLGTYAQTEISQAVEIPADTAHVGVFVEGKRYRGECYLEHPFLSADGQNLLPAFAEAVPDSTHMEWTGQFLSHKEWPVFRVRLNGKTVFCGEIFERSHRHSEWEIALPAHLLRAENTLTYELLSEHHDPLPYTFYEIGLIEQPDEALSLLSVSEIAPVGGKVRILIRTKRKNTRVTLTPTHSALRGGGEFLFEEAGLHGLLLDATEAASNATFTLRAGKNRIDAKVPHVLLRGEDSVITGTGDMIYIQQTDEAMEEYLAWYLSEQVGDLVTIRPAYRWSGTRTINPSMWKWVVRLFDELGLKYVLMMDGRELPGISAQPDAELSGGKGYLGRQTHEYDGRQLYWGEHRLSSLTQEQLNDLYQLSYEEDPAHTSFGYSSNNYIATDREVYRFTDRRRPRDNHLCRDLVVDMLKKTRRPDDIRHTGPACAFKYFRDAGYRWLGAETMYSTMEPILGFLRGLAKDKGMPQWGVHHALQWSSTPHECPEHYRRFRLALYSSYLLGATDINTEEGLWHLEEYYEHHHRFSLACRSHLKQQQDFYRYVSSHTRSGEFRTPFAILYGRDDGINFFVRKRVWGINMEETPAETAWQLTKALYPQSVPAQCVYQHGCPTDRPVGYHTSTPYGNADIPPAESDLETLKSYRSLFFLGYHRMTREDADKLLSCVRNGATLLLTRAHLTETTNIEAIRRGEFSFAHHALSFCEGDASFAPSTVNGKALSVCRNSPPATEVLSTTDDGTPLLCRYAVGAGEILLFNTTAYPADEAIRSLYEAEMKRIVQQATDAEPIWAGTKDDAEFAVYRQADGGAHVYFLAVDWYRPEKDLRRAELRLGEQRYEVSFPFGVLIKCVTDGHCAAWATAETGEVLSVSDEGIRVQGMGKENFCIAKDGIVRTLTVDCSENKIQIIH